jgi:hypothetical protein
MQNLKLKMDANLKAINEMQESFERWKAIYGYENYSVSSFGRVRNDNGRFIKPSIIGTGYYSVGLYKSGVVRKHIRIHRLVAIAFITNQYNKPCVDHIDNNQLNNNVTNLRWVTLTENQQNRTINKNSTSCHKGVYFRKQVKKWSARIQINGIRIFLGLFDNIEDATKARIDRANLEFGVYTNSCEKK